ncbi:MAG: AAA family ATPase [Clostridia bacterium]|nr:AAA family ATPase [Clostridia bacterium]
MKYGLLGKKLAHSFSKEIHDLIGDYGYELVEKTPDEVENFIKNGGFKAINVTIPYKETVMPFLDVISDKAKMIGSVNTVVRRDGKLYGYNTDFIGFSSMIDRAGIEVKGKTVAVLGTGGTCKTAYAVCKSRGAKEVLKVSRNPDSDSISYLRLYERRKDISVIVNTTPCGMYPDNESFAVDVDEFENLEGVVDVIYNPLKTPLLQRAEKRGLKTSNGLYMLVSQAVAASELFFDTKYPEDLLDEVYGKILRSKRNIVLCGMPGSGKTTVGKLLAEMTGRKLVDTDDEIVKEIKTDIASFFKKFGESEFRKVESNVINEVSKQSGIIISTGGGAVLGRKNVDRLKQNGRIYFLDRPLSELVATPDRPTADTDEKIRLRFEERYPIYISCADETIDAHGSPEEIAAEIIRRGKE